MNKNPSVESLQEGILNKDRAALAQAISLVESTKIEHKQMAQELVSQLMPYTGKAKRIGITGTPGAGKSTFIESLGMEYIRKGETVAVLAVDPSSAQTQGSILGDKTRMEQLSKSEEAFIRPSPSKGYYGGIAIATYEAMLLCEAYGFENVLIETVGVGQSETMVADIVDMFVLLAVAGGGDELQGIKRGIMEMADFIFINKIDSEPNPKEIAFYTDLKRALTYFPSEEKNWMIPVMMGSALEKREIDTAFETINEYFNITSDNGWLQNHRQSQNLKRFQRVLERNVIDRFWEKSKSKEEIREILRQVENGEMFTLDAVQKILQNMG